MQNQIDYHSLINISDLIQRLRKELDEIRSEAKQITPAHLQLIDAIRSAQIAKKRCEDRMARLVRS